MNDFYQSRKKKFKNKPFSSALDIYADMDESSEENNIELSQEEYEDQRSKAMDISLRYLGYKARSEKKMREYLHKKNISDDVINEVIEKLGEYGYCDDRALAESIMTSDTKNKRLGVRRSVHRMKGAGIQDDLSSDFLENKDEALEKDNALYWAEKMLPKISGDKFSRRNKLSARLANKGFSYSTISSVLGELNFDDFGDEL